jgi:ribosomal protein S18 acetylase RimI-like enzyme
MQQPSTTKTTTDTVRLRRPTPADAESCATICFDAFCGINARHGFPPDFAGREVAAGLMEWVLNNPQVYGVVAEDASGRVIGSNFLWEADTIAGIGPITVDPAAQERSVGRRLMEHVLDRVAERRFPGVRLVQAAFNTRSMSLYTKLGFEVREPLVVMQGPPINSTVPGVSVRKATEADVEACCDLCRKVHGHDRRAELTGTIAGGTATVAERGGEVVGYATDVGFFAHTVAADNAALVALIGAAPQFSGPGFLLPSRNAEVFRWCLANGLRVVEPMTLMSRGLYNEPRGAFIPSILF